MAYEHLEGTPAAQKMDRTGETAVLDGRPKEVRPSVAAAVRSLRDRMPAIRPNGIFRHPSDWTEEEMAFIADSLKMNVPIYTIANMVHCERHVLSRLIENTPELRRLKEDKYENLLDEAEYQADRLMKAGNSSLVIYVLQTLGKKRGWGDGSEGGEGDEAGSDKIVMGEIPAEEVERANEETARKIKESGGVANINPLQMAITEDAVKAEVDRQMESNGLKAVEAEGRVIPNGGGESVVERDAMNAMEGYMSPTGGGYGAAPDDPWSDGANSPFFQ